MFPRRLASHPPLLTERDTQLWASAVKWGPLTSTVELVSGLAVADPTEEVSGMAGDLLTISSPDRRKRVLVYGCCQFPGCKYSHRAVVQATKATLICS